MVRGWKKNYNAAQPSVGHKGNSLVTGCLKLIILVVVVAAGYQWYLRDRGDSAALVPVQPPAPLATPVGVQPCTEVSEECGEHNTSATGNGKPTLGNGLRFAQGTNSTCHYAAVYGVDCADVMAATEQMRRWHNDGDDQ